jgi:phosphomannomutase
MEIFRKYDVRGIYPSELNENNAFDIGRALATQLRGKKIFLNYDNRIGSINIKEAFTNGLIRSGATVYELGMGPVTVSSFASFKENACGICISASHNPKEYTGILTYVNGVTLTPEKTKKIYTHKKFFSKFGKPIPFEYDKEYIEYITKKLNRCNIRVGIDSMGGATTFIAPYVFKLLGYKVSELRTSPSSDFYGKIPEPSIENCKDLGKLVKKDKLDFGIQLDADGDRAMVVDDLGRALDPMVTSMVLLKHLALKRTVATIACSSRLEAYSKVKYVKTGRPNVEIEMKTGKYDFGVESASHFYFGEYYPFSDGILTGLLIGKVLNTTNKKLSKLIDEFPKIYYKNISLKFTNEKDIRNKMNAMVKKLKGYKHQIKIDGIKINLDGGFMLFRQSNTEPLIRVYYEGHNQSVFRRIGKLVDSIIK